MAGYFSYFPTINYNGVMVKNITQRTKIIETLYNDPYSFLPYTVIENQKPEDVAYYYYGSVDYVWLVILSNNIIDPFFEWPLDEERLFKSIAKKYKTKAMESTGNQNITDYETFYWTMSNGTTDNIDHYFNEKTGLRMSLDTYRLSEKEEKEDYFPVRIYDIEFQKNENNRNINLLNNQYAKLAEKNLKELLSND